MGRAVIVLLVLVPVIYAKPPAQQNPPAATVWVSHEFIGGPKCVALGPATHYLPPGFETEKAKLRKAEIRVLREYFQDRATCQACHTCPNYSREIFFEIHEADLPRGEKLGYRKTAAPDPEALREYEGAKRYKPKPDVPADAEEGR